MTTLNESLVLAMERSNNKEGYVIGTETLLRLLDNIIREPQNAKYRTVRLENKTIKEKLMAVDGMRDLMLEIGYVEANGTLTLPATVVIAKLRKYRDFICERKELIKNPPSTSAVTFAPTTTKVLPQLEIEKTNSKPVIRAGKSFRKRIAFPKVISSNNGLLQQLEVLSDQVMQYDDDELLQSGRDIIPLEMLRIRAKEKLRRVQKMIKSGTFDDEEPLMEDLILEELVSWFKSDFFRWINAMPCSTCGNEKTELVDNLLQDGVRVEVYKCCNQLRRFFRYNDVEKLLHTRCGRCGEWANCFTFLCRALGYEARFVFSTGDHVWTEVYSARKRRWIHVDPCENAIDSPLMYEHGWKKEICYVFAFSHEDIQDVTWRYSNEHNKVQMRRVSCTEKELLEAILKLRAKRRENVSEARLKYLRKRTLDECLQLLNTRVPTQAELEGRSSGSLEWRLQRGERKLNVFYIFIPNEQEIRSEQFNLRYSCSKDIYERFLKNPAGDVILESSKSWQSRQYTSENIFRKEEHDWKMVYLARQEGTEQASISWKFDFSIQGLVVKDIRLTFRTQTYEEASIQVAYVKDDGTPLPSIRSLIGLGKFTIQAKLIGGKMWQHSQIFRQGKYDEDYPFELNVQFLRST
ncbi:peptide-N(4)-(N-acetyl-beta-glucosaminyl)asparagine amidase [Topomyia yanbarensis]|uniref:peptide-N(4)-(N-acetyl-beta- glucosaminyl)asparagine amidase n=1 Tax=Topomyia yanbarensis TaxID=2498891 RepID=UPI00273BA142|nr:peptide-N(4)-(N-acetyl-beta-glucosaminyl)asparagine amidase [Topomyia yanbarensis]